jgi:ankyrin repeat protein
MYDEVEKMLNEGKSGHPVEINYKSLDDWTPLHYACYEGHEDVADLLLNHGANANALTKFKRNSLHISVLRGYLNVAKVLLLKLRPFTGIKSTVTLSTKTVTLHCTLQLKVATKTSLSTCFQFTVL